MIPKALAMEDMATFQCAHFLIRYLLEADLALDHLVVRFLPLFPLLLEEALQSLSLL